MRAMSNDDLIGSTTAGEILGISPATVTRWVHAGILPVRARIQTGSGAQGAMVFVRAEVEQIAEQIRRNKEQTAP